MLLEALIAIALLSISLVSALTYQWHALQKAQQMHHRLLAQQWSYDLALMPTQWKLAIPLPQGRITKLRGIQWWDAVAQQQRTQHFP